MVSSSIGCLKTVISLNVQRKRTTLSFSFLIGATCMYSHTGLPDMTEERKYENKEIWNFVIYILLYNKQDEIKDVGMRKGSLDIIILWVNIINM